MWSSIWSVATIRVKEVKEVACWFKFWKTQLVLFDLFCLTSLLQKLMFNIIDLKKYGLFLVEKSYFKILRLSFSSKLDCGSYIISIVKTVSNKIGTLIRSMKFCPPEVSLCLFKSIIRLWMEYFCHIWPDAPRCFLEMLDKLQKQIFRTVRPSFAASLEPLGDRRNVVSLRLSYRYCFGRCLSELAQLVPLPYSRGRLTRYSEIILFFLSPFLDVISI